MAERELTVAETASLGVTLHHVYALIWVVS